MSLTGGERLGWRVERGALRARRLRWRPFSVAGTGSTNQLWRAEGACGEWLLKWYKYPQPGVHPEPEVAKFLQAQSFAGTPEFGARLDHFQNGDWQTAAFVQRWNNGNSVWDTVLGAMRARSVDQSCASDLGLSIGALHRVLASGGPETAFCVTPWTSLSHHDWVARVERGALDLYAALEGEPPQGVAAKLWESARAVWLKDAECWRGRIRALAELRVEGALSRVHGDLHLGQLLEQADVKSFQRFTVVDFEGEPSRSTAERRKPDLPLRDVAGMIRSFSYAAAVAGAPEAVAEAWSDAFLQGWCEQMSLPAGNWRGLLAGLVWEKAVYEALYELRHRPDWLWIPLRKLQDDRA